MNINDKVKFIINTMSKENLTLTELNYSSDYELLIAIILSAQCTDARVNTVTPSLFQQYNNYKSLANANENDVYGIIKSISYPNIKSKRIINISKYIHIQYNDIVPNDINKLVSINGIGRKTANLILNILYDYNGIAVDTHVIKLSNRLGLIISSNPENIEYELQDLFPVKYYKWINTWFVYIGRYICNAKKPKCNICPLNKICLFNHLC